MNKIVFSFSLLAVSTAMLTAQNAKLIPLTERVNVQADSARINQVIDGCWVAVGTDKPHSIQRDYTIPFNGKPSYRFELKTEDNTLEGYAKGETKGRAEFSYCYATSADFKGQPEVFMKMRRRPKPFIIMEKVYVRKVLHVIMSFQFIFLPH